MQAKLRVVDGAKPAVVRLKLPTTIGRSGTATLTVRSSQISRRHCEIDTYEGELTVRDLDSSNGTFVNGHRISDVTFLSPGDELRIGPLTFVAEYEIEAPSRCDPTVELPEPSAEGASEKPSSPKPTQQVVDDQPQPSQTGISSVIHYEENTDGSFLGIEELSKADAQDGEPPLPATDESSPAGKNESQPSPDSQAIDLGLAKKARPVDPEDSQLNKFFEGLS